VLAANIAFSGFPLLAAMLANDRCLPRQMAWLGDRLVYQNGIGVLLGFTAVIIWICQGDTTVAVNLYALGVFTAFTLSQLGLVLRWWRQRGPGWQGRMAMNALGASATFVVLLVIIVSKFREGAWTVVIAIPLLVWVLAAIRRRHREVDAALAPDPAIAPVYLAPTQQEVHHQAIVWMGGLSRSTLEAVRYACSIADQVTAVMVMADREDPGRISLEWDRLMGADTGALQFEMLMSPYSSVIDPFRQFVQERETSHPDCRTTVVMPVAVPRNWFDRVLLNQRALYLYRSLQADQGTHVFCIVRTAIDP